MKILKYFVFFLLMVSISFTVQSQTQSNQAKVEVSEMNYAEHLWFDSKILGEETSMNVYLPTSFYQAPDTQSYPVIFINGSHGRNFFMTLSGVVKHLSELDRMPESIVVSLNYSGHFPKVYTNNMWPTRSEIDGYGDTEKYFKHLTTELFPYLENNYRANQSRTLIGVSGSAIFPLYSFIYTPQIFENVILLAAMDMIGMGFEQNEDIITAIANSLKENSKLKRTLYLAVADDDIDGEDDLIYVENLKRIERTLSPYQSPKFDFSVDVISNERHYAAFIKAMLNALEKLYPENLWAAKYRELIAKPGDALANIDAHYLSLSKRYGYEILAKAERWNSVNSLEFIANKLLKDGRLNEAVSMAVRRTSYRPHSADAQFQLAKILAADKQISKAMEANQKAITLAETNKDKNLAEYKTQLSELKKLQN